MEQNGIKALALKVIQRNNQRNMNGTEGEIERNKTHNHGTDRGTLQKTFDSLFREHMAFLRGHSTTLDEIRRHDPEIAEELLSLSRAMDAAWLREDLPAFRESMQRLETRYLQAHRWITAVRLLT
ncbi:MAG: hypothetical protein U0411_06590 [Thermodesulfovibrionales bacterium]